MNCFHPNKIQCNLPYRNPVGNKIVKYKMPAFYFVLGNIPAKYSSRLNDIHLLLLSPSPLVQKIWP